MKYTIHEQDGSKVAVLEERGVVINDVQTALDLMATFNGIHRVRATSCCWISPIYRKLFLN